MKLEEIDLFTYFAMLGGNAVALTKTSIDQASVRVFFASPVYPKDTFSISMIDLAAYNPTAANIIIFPEGALEVNWVASNMIIQNLMDEQHLRVFAQLNQAEKKIVENATEAFTNLPIYAPDRAFEQIFEEISQISLMVGLQAIIVGGRQYMDLDSATQDRKISEEALYRYLKALEVQAKRHKEFLLSHLDSFYKNNLPLFPHLDTTNFFKGNDIITSIGALASNPAEIENILEYLMKKVDQANDEKELTEAVRYVRLSLPPLPKITNKRQHSVTLDKNEKRQRVIDMFIEKTAKSNSRLNDINSIHKFIDFRKGQLKITL